MCFFSFQKNIPIITCLCNPGIRQRHWNQMGKVIGFDITPNSGQLSKKFSLKLPQANYAMEFIMFF